MKEQSVTNVEYLLRTVRESERMQGWQDTFSKMREDFSKELSQNMVEMEEPSVEAEDTFEM